MQAILLNPNMNLAKIKTVNLFCNAIKKSQLGAIFP